MCPNPRGAASVMMTNNPAMARVPGIQCSLMEKFR